MHICSFYEFCSVCWFAFWRWMCMMKKSWRRVSFLVLFFFPATQTAFSMLLNTIFIHTKNKTLYWNTPPYGPHLDLFTNDLELNSLDLQDKSKFPPASGPQWPDVEDIRKLPFDLYPRDHKFRYASPVYTDRMPKTLNGIKLLFLLWCALFQSRLKILYKYVYVLFCICTWNTGVKVERLEAEVEPPKRNTVSVRLSLFAAHNAFHHCEQCHHYSEPAPAAQVRAYVIDHVMHQHILKTPQT